MKISKRFLMPLKSFADKIWYLSIGRIKKILKKALWRKLGLKWRLRSGITVELKYYADWVMYNEIFIDGEYDMAINQAITLAHHNGTLNFLDLGANVGFFSIKLIDQIYKSGKSDIDFNITLVEGSPMLYKELVTRLNSSPFADRLRIIHGLAGERNGYTEIYEYDYHQFNSVFHDNSIHKVKLRYKARYVDLTSLYNNDAAIDLLKCDIEGSEQRFLENYKDMLCRTKIAVFEFHNLRCDAARCINLLKGAGLINHKQLRKKPDGSTDMFWR